MGATEFGAKRGDADSVSECLSVTTIVARRSGVTSLNPNITPASGVTFTSTTSGLAVSSLMRTLNITLKRHEEYLTSYHILRSEASALLGGPVKIHHTGNFEYQYAS